jgi:hypothetical protein
MRKISEGCDCRSPSRATISATALAVAAMKIGA